jgi:hypothetical protein
MKNDLETPTSAHITGRMTVNGNRTPESQCQEPEPKVTTVSFTLYPEHVGILQARHRELQMSGSRIVRILIEHEGRSREVARTLRRRYTARLTSKRKKKRL